MLIRYILGLALFLVPSMAFGTSTLTFNEVQQVYEKLTIAIGDFKNNLPEIAIETSKEYGAGYMPSANKIFIEQAALDVCNSFGTQSENALAFLLAHELAHFYQKHDWKESGFATSFIGSQIVLDTKIHNEQEADTYGAFMAHLAGYETVAIIPPLLERIYAAYEITHEEPRGYPSLSDRQLMVKEVCKTVQNLMDIFNAGNYLGAIGNYENSLACYEYLLQYFKCRELYNNIGIVALYASIETTDKKEATFFYPLSLDVTIPLRAITSLDRPQLLQKAIKAFQEAINFDNRYYEAYIHLACAYDMNGERAAAISLANEIQKIITPQSKILQAKYFILKGILAAKQNQINEANQFFESAKIAGATENLKRVANNNLQILSGNKLSFLPQSEPLLNLIDQLDKVDLLFWNISLSEADENILLKNKGLDQQRLLIRRLPKSTIFLIQSNFQRSKIQLNNRPEVKTLQNVGVGDSLIVLQKAYVDSQLFTISTRLGAYWLIPEKGLFFLTNELDIINEWGTYVK